MPLGAEDFLPKDALKAEDFLPKDAKVSKAPPASPPAVQNLLPVPAQNSSQGFPGGAASSPQDFLPQDALPPALSPSPLSPAQATVTTPASGGDFLPARTPAPPEATAPPSAAPNLDLENPANLPGFEALTPSQRYGAIKSYADANLLKRKLAVAGLKAAPIVTAQPVVQWVGKQFMRPVQALNAMINRAQQDVSGAVPGGFLQAAQNLGQAAYQGWTYQDHTRFSDLIDNLGPKVATALYAPVVNLSMPLPGTDGITRNIPFNLSTQDAKSFYDFAGPMMEGFALDPLAGGAVRGVAKLVGAGVEAGAKAAAGSRVGVAIKLPEAAKAVENGLRATFVHGTGIPAVDNLVNQRIALKDYYFNGIMRKAKEVASIGEGLTPAQREIAGFLAEEPRLDQARTMASSVTSGVVDPSSIATVSQGLISPKAFNRALRFDAETQGKIFDLAEGVQRLNTTYQRSSEPRIRNSSLGRNSCKQSGKGSRTTDHRQHQTAEKRGSEGDSGGWGIFHFPY